MNFDDYGTMVVIVDGKLERRAIDCIQPSPMGHGLHQYVPVLREGEMVMHTISGETHIIYTGII